MGLEEPAYPACEEVCPYARQRLIGSSQTGASCGEQGAGTVLHQLRSAEVVRNCQELSRTRLCAHNSWAVRSPPTRSPSPLTPVGQLGGVGGEGEKAFLDQLNALRSVPTLDLQDQADALITSPSVAALACSSPTSSPSASRRSS